MQVLRDHLGTCMHTDIPITDIEVKLKYVLYLFMTLHMTEDICDKLQIFGLRSWDIAKVICS